MKKIFGMLVALLFCGNVFSQGIEFQHVSFKEALAKAKAENKMVFMDCYTSWCGPCKALAKNIFPQKEVGDFFNANYICIKMDMEKGEGPALLKKYEIKGFPTLLYLDSEGKVISQRVGGTDAAGLIADGKTAGDPKERIEYVSKQYELGDRRKKTVSKYIALLQKNYKREEMAKVGVEFLKTLTNEDLLDPSNFKAYSKLSPSFESEKFQYVFNNKEKFIGVIGEKAVNQLIMYAYYDYLQVLASGSDFDKLKNTIADFDKLYADPRNVDFYRGLQESYYLSNKQFDKWFNSKQKQLNKAEVSGNERYCDYLVSAAMSVARESKFADASGAYDKALNWAKEAVKLNANVQDVDICMALLYQKKGDKKNALKCLKCFEDKNPKMSERMERNYKSIKAKVENI